MEYNNNKIYMSYKSGIQFGNYEEVNGVDRLLTEFEVLRFLLNDGIGLSNYRGHMTSENGWIIHNVPEVRYIPLDEFLKDIILSD